MKTNKLHKMLKEGRPTLGTRVHSIWPATVEALGHTGMFDYVEFLAEYAPFDLFSLDNFCRTVELFIWDTAARRIIPKLSVIRS